MNKKPQDEPSNADKLRWFAMRADMVGFDLTFTDPQAPAPVQIRLDYYGARLVLQAIKEALKLHEERKLIRAEIKRLVAQLDPQTRHSVVGCLYEAEGSAGQTEAAA